MSQIALITKLCDLTKNDTIQWEGSTYTYKASKNGATVILKKEDKGDQREAYWEYSIHTKMPNEKSAILIISEMVHRSIEFEIENQKKRYKDKETDAKLGMLSQAIDMLASKESLE